MQLERIELFNTKKEFSLFLLASLFIFSFTLLILYNNYKHLTRFDTYFITATIIKQYEKSKITKSGKVKKYQVLKLKSDEGLNFYTASKPFISSIGKKIKLKIWTRHISFYEYLTTFYAYSNILQIYDNDSLKTKLNTFIANQHRDANSTALYQALFSATPLQYELQTRFSYLGISHLIAISGFHLGVLSFFLFLLFKTPYKFLQNRYFPHRSYRLDSFIVISLVLFAYLIFLEYPPSLLRSYAMLIIGISLYERGYKIISMQTLFVTLILLLVLFPKLLFSLGFWLSISGVFYIFLFLIYFKDRTKLWQFLLLPFFLYFMMLPYSLALFGNFSIYHPLSIIWSTLFTLFYPLSIFLHVVGWGNFLDRPLNALLSLSNETLHVNIHYSVLALFTLLSLVSIKNKKAFMLLHVSAVTISIYAFSEVV